MTIKANKTAKNKKFLKLLTEIEHYIKTASITDVEQLSKHDSITLTKISIAIGELLSIQNRLYKEATISISGLNEYSKRIRNLITNYIPNNRIPIVRVVEAMNYIEKPMTVEDIREATGLQYDIVNELMKKLKSKKIVKEIDLSSYNNKIYWSLCKRPNAIAFMDRVKYKIERFK